MHASREMLKNPACVLFDGSIALKASNEMVVLVLLLPSIITMLTHPDSVDDNPLLTRLGYNDACVTFDTKPAVYLALVLYFAVCYFIFVHVVCAISRLEIENQGRLVSMPRGWRWFCNFSNAMYGVSAMAFSLVFMIPPTESVWLHSIFFVFLMIFRYSAFCAAFVEHMFKTSASDSNLEQGESNFQQNMIKYGSKRFMTLYGIATFAAPVCWFMCYAEYDRVCEGVPEGECSDYQFPVPPALTAFFDYTWFVCLPLSPIFLPPNFLKPEAMLLKYQPGLLFDNTAGLLALQRSVGVAGEEEEEADEEEV
ncbi:hypothetical protein TrVE_jg8023 [Triparma verrucosa]|uniref:Uncharacterized protein n=2 Tax=Triparma TaxID=722752 RepID=A0A9W7B2X4_9STRA|nr:hypothetical protein TrST_g4444 [Triparma strigata]GMH84511.1 hypothetical protein TrVE_jg8023 [Triparma verrucosa]